MPILSVKRIIQMSLQSITSQALFQAFGPCSPEPLCLSLGVSILLTHHGPSLSLWNDRGQKFLFSCRKFLVCHHQQKGRFCCLALWRLRDEDSESHSLVSAVVFLKINKFYNRLMLFLYLQHIFSHLYIFWIHHRPYERHIIWRAVRHIQIWSSHQPRP